MLVKDGHNKIKILLCVHLVIYKFLSMIEILFHIHIKLWKMYIKLILVYMISRIINSHQMLIGIIHIILNTLILIYTNLIKSMDKSRNYNNHHSVV